MPKFLCPCGEKSRRKVRCNSPNVPRRYNSKYARFLADFRILRIKNCWGQTHVRWDALASVGHWSSYTNCEIFLGGKDAYLLRYERPKKLILSGLKNGPIFSVCGPKFIKFGRHLQEWSQYVRRFPVDCILCQSGDICNKGTQWRVESYVFRPKIFGEKDSQNQILCP